MAYTPPPGPARGTPPLPPSHLAPKYVPPPSATTTKVQYVTTQNPFGYHSSVPSPHAPLSQQGVAYRPPMGTAPPPPQYHPHHPPQAPYSGYRG